MDKKKGTLLSNYLIALSCDKELSIWGKKDNDNKKYSIIKVFTTNNNSYIKDMIFVENGILVCLLGIMNSTNTNNAEILFFNYNSLPYLIQEKKISNIQCKDGNIEENNFLYLFKQYLLIKGSNGIYILSNKTKEIVQYLNLLNHNYRIYKVIPNNNDILYIPYILTEKEKYMSMDIYKFIEGSFVNTEKYNNIEIEDQDKDELLASPLSDSFDLSVSYLKTFNGFCINENQIFIWKDNIFKFREKYDDSNE